VRAADRQQPLRLRLAGGIRRQQRREHRGERNEGPAPIQPAPAGPPSRMRAPVPVSPPPSRDTTPMIPIHNALPV